MARENPEWIKDAPDVAFRELYQAGCDPDPLHEWCTRWLSAEQQELLLQIVRMVTRHQQVYKRTVLISPRAHMLIKTLAELESLRMSEVLEIHLDRVLREHHGLALRTSVDEHSGQVDYDLERTTATAFMP